MEVKNMNNPVDPRKIPHFIERLAKAGYILDVECSKREIRITYNRSASKYTTIPFGQTRLSALFMSLSILREICMNKLLSSNDSPMAPGDSNVGTGPICGSDEVTI